MQQKGNVSNEEGAKTVSMQYSKEFSSNVQSNIQSDIQMNEEQVINQLVMPKWNA